MPRPSDTSSLHRAILRDAFESSFRDRIYWPLAIGSTILFGAGAYDFGWKAVSSILDNHTSLLPWSGSSERVDWLFQDFLDAGTGFFGAFTATPILTLLAIVFISLGILGVLCQSGLIYALGARHTGAKAPTITEAVSKGAAYFWPVAVMNLLLLGSMWLLRFFVAVALSFGVNTPTPGFRLLYTLSFILFMGLHVVASIVLIFSLHRIILHRASARDALREAYAIFKMNWLVCAETAISLIGIAFGTGIFLLGACFVLLIPPFFGYLLAFAFQSYTLFGFTTWISVLSIFLLSISAIGFLVQLQYTTWTNLWIRIAEGTATAKLHRLFR